MIEKVGVENFFGIRDFSVDFVLKHVVGGKDEDLEEQMIKTGDKHISLFPSFIAKNAAGKTSFIKSIDFAMRFMEEENFISQLTHYSLIMHREITKRNDINNGEINIGVSYAEMLIKVLFNQVSFAGSKFANVSIELTKNRKAKLEISADSFHVVTNNSTIDVLKVLSIIETKIIDEEFETQREVVQTIDKIIRGVVKDKKFEFYTGVSCISLFRADKSITLLKDIYLKNETRSNMGKIIESFGFEAFKTLLTKIDVNISTISFDTESKAFDIYLHGIEVPISPKRLSFGTNKIIEIIAKSIDLFKSGGIMMVDEIENGLHLSLIKLIVKLYEDDEINIAKAQLFITTHNPSIFEEGIIKSHNIFVSEGNSMISLKEESSKMEKARRSDREAMIKTKNYFNDYYWKSRNLEPKSSLNNLKINLIIYSMAEGKTWHKKR